jgi:tRNA dimethylallyltransferase
MDVTEPLSVADFQQRARSVIAEIRGRGATPVLVGGSALYTRAILDRFEFPGTDPAVRARLETELAAVGPAALHARLRGLDPEAADRILVENGRRVVRALEAIEITGRPFSASLPRLEYADPASVQVGVDIDRPTLDSRIEQRVARMFEGGFVAEVERLLAQGLAEGRTASRAIGYREVASYLAGELGLDDARERTVVATRRFARRQDSWFRKDPRITWVRYDDPARVDLALSAVRATMEA